MMTGLEMEGFKDLMGFNPTNDVLYEDNVDDNTIPDIQVFLSYYCLVTPYWACLLQGVPVMLSVVRK